MQPCVRFCVHFSLALPLAHPLPAVLARSAFSLDNASFGSDDTFTVGIDCDARTVQFWREGAASSLLPTSRPCLPFRLCLLSLPLLDFLDRERRSVCSASRISIMPLLCSG
jgi:hypothetical protein